MNKKGNKKRITDSKRWIFLVAFLIVITLFNFNKTSSRYMAEIASNTDAIAVPILTFTNNQASYHPEVFWQSLQLHLYFLLQYHNFYNPKDFLHKNQVPLLISHQMQTTEQFLQSLNFQLVFSKSDTQSFPQAVL